MHVGIAGAGAVAMGYAAYLLKSDHEASVWSPSGRRTAALDNGAALEVSGALEGSYHPSVCNNVEALASNDVIILALPANGHRQVLDALVPHIEARHTVFISGHLSFAALYLSKRLAERGIQIPIAVWNTTVLTAKAPSTPTAVRIGALRDHVEMATVPKDMSRCAAEICVNLFGDRFRFQNDLISIALSNLNPQSHLGIALCNLTRIERGEGWCQNTNITPSVANLIEALDRERCEIARALGRPVETMAATMSKSLQVREASLLELYQIRVARGTNPPGPKSVDTRYIWEDVPFGLLPTVMLAELAGVEAPLHKSGIHLLSVCLGSDLSAKNDLLAELGRLDAQTVKRLSNDGYPISTIAQDIVPEGGIV